MVNKGSTELSEEELKEIAGGMKLTTVQKISLAMAAALGTTIAALSLNQVYQILKK